MTNDNTFHLFNTETMSGVHPGSRTQQAHIVRLQPCAPPHEPHTWVRILWPETTGECVVYRQKNGSQWEEEPFLALPPGDAAQTAVRLVAALQSNGERPQVCGVCRWWQPVTGAVNADGVPLGRCRWRDGAPVAGSEQAFFALACPHWETGAQPPPTQATEAVAAPSAAPAVGWWTALRRRLWKEKKKHAVVRMGSLADVIERSGVGAGTERCLACHGRIANLGALSVATEADDKRTLSVWRCRLCHTFYLNDWIDRWERLDSLETEESYYRIAPGEAISLLTLFRETPGSEHPKDRHRRTHQRNQVDAFLAGRPHLLHQVKQGR